jgi:hypothetical protein
MGLSRWNSWMPTFAGENARLVCNVNTGAGRGRAGPKWGLARRPPCRSPRPQRCGPRASSHPHPTPGARRAGAYISPQRANARCVTCGLRVTVLPSLRESVRACACGAIHGRRGAARAARAAGPPPGGTRRAPRAARVPNGAVPPRAPLQARRWAGAAAARAPAAALRCGGGGRGAAAGAPPARRALSRWRRPGGCVAVLKWAGRVPAGGRRARLAGTSLTPSPTGRAAPRPPPPPRRLHTRGGGTGRRGRGRGGGRRAARSVAGRAHGHDVPDVLRGAGGGGRGVWWAREGTWARRRGRRKAGAAPRGSCLRQPGCPSAPPPRRLAHAPNPIRSSPLQTPPRGPPHLGVLHDRAVAAELAAAGGVQDGAARPLVLVLVQLRGGAGGGGWEGAGQQGGSGVALAGSRSRQQPSRARAPAGPLGAERRARAPAAAPAAARGGARTLSTSSWARR